MINNKTQPTTEGIALAVERLTDAQIKHMAERFLMWKLPTPWRPDAGIKFEPHINPGCIYDHQRDGPVGTNLFDYTQAEQMVRYMVEGVGNTASTELLAEREAHEATKAKLAASDADWAEVDRIARPEQFQQLLPCLHKIATIAASHRPEREVDVLVEAISAAIGEHITPGAPWDRIRAELAKRGVNL